MPQPILDYFQKHKQLIEENLSLCEDPEYIEAIHNFRLSIKRLRVLARLAELLNNESFNAKNRLKEINKLFKRSGRLRDVQVTRQLLIELNQPELQMVIESFARRERKQRLKFEHGLEIFNKESFAEFEHALTITFHEVSQQQLMHAGLRLLSALEIEIHELYHSSAKEKRLHDIRTRLKNLNYLNNIFDDQLPVQDQLNISIDRLQEIGDIAGSWHDCLNLERKLKKFVKIFPEKEIQLSAIIKDITIRKQGLCQEYSCILMNEMKV